MSFDSNKGTSRLGGVLTNRMKSMSQGELSLDFGEITGDYSLKTNGFPIPIPATDYSVCWRAGDLSWTMSFTGGTHGGHEGGNGSHTHTITIAEPPIKPGDRVLVAWIENEAVVIDKVLSAEKIRKG